MISRDDDASARCLRLYSIGTDRPEPSMTQRHRVRHDSYRRTPPRAQTREPTTSSKRIPCPCTRDMTSAKVRNSFRCSHWLIGLDISDGLRGRVSEETELGAAQNSSDGMLYVIPLCIAMPWFSKAHTCNRRKQTREQSTTIQ